MLQEDETAAQKTFRRKRSRHRQLRRYVPPHLQVPR
jgi:hypothetical protein